MESEERLPLKPNHLIVNKETVMKTANVKSITTKRLMEGLSEIVEDTTDFKGFVGTLKMKVTKVEKRPSTFKKKKELETVLSGLAKFDHVNGTEYRATVVFLPEHIVSDIVAGELVELPIHRIESVNSPNGFTFVSERVIEEEEWDF